MCPGHVEDQEDPQKDICCAASRWEDYVVAAQQDEEEEAVMVEVGVPVGLATRAVVQGHLRSCACPPIDSLMPSLHLSRYDCWDLHWKRAARAEIAPEAVDLRVAMEAPWMPTCIAPSPCALVLTAAGRL